MPLNFLRNFRKHSARNLRKYTTYLPLPAEHVGAVPVERDSVAETAVMRQLQERVIDRLRRRYPLPSNTRIVTRRITLSTRQFLVALCANMI